MDGLLYLLFDINLQALGPYDSPIPEKEMTFTTGFSPNRWGNGYPPLSANIKIPAGSCILQQV